MYCSWTTMLATLASIFALLPCSLSSDFKVRQKLMNEVFRGYNRLVPPQENVTQPVVITVELRILKLLKLDQFNQTLSIIAWIHLTWKDIRLNWEPIDYKEVDHMVVPVKKIWKPDIVLQRSDDVMKQLHDVDARVKNDGSVRLTLPYLLNTPCKTNPEDREETCYIRLGSWIDDADLVDVTPANNIANAFDLERNKRWEMLRTRAYRDVKTCENAPDYSCSYVVFQLELSKRKGVDEKQEEDNAGSATAVSAVLVLLSAVVSTLRTVL